MISWVIDAVAQLSMKRGLLSESNRTECALTSLLATGAASIVVMHSPFMRLEFHCFRRLLVAGDLGLGRYLGGGMAASSIARLLAIMVAIVVHK